MNISVCGHAHFWPCESLEFLLADDRPEMKFLNRYVRESLCAKGTDMWKDLGIELLGSTNALDVISNNNNDIRNCCSAMFQLWLDRQPTASWRQLIEALKQLRLTYLADQIESKFSISVLDPIPGDWNRYVLGHEQML